MSTVSKMLPESTDDESHASEISLDSTEPSSVDDDDDDDFEPGTKSKMPKKHKADKKHTTVKASKPKAALKKSPGTKSAPDQVNGGTKEKIIQGLLELLQFQIADAPKVQTALVAGYKNMRSAGFTSPLKELNSEGMVEFPSKDSVRLTAKGASSVTPLPPFQNNKDALLRVQEIFERFCGKKAPKVDQICLFLSDGKQYTLQEIATATKLVSLDLLERSVSLTPAAPISEDNLTRNKSSLHAIFY